MGSGLREFTPSQPITVTAKHKEDVRERICQMAAEPECRLSMRDAEELCDAASTLLALPLFHAAPRVDKRALYDEFFFMQERVNAHLKSFSVPPLQLLPEDPLDFGENGAVNGIPLTAFQTRVPLWQVFWTALWWNRTDPLFEGLDRTSYGGTYGATGRMVSAAMVEEGMKVLSKSVSQNARPAAQNIPLEASLQSLYESLANMGLLTHFKGIHKTRRGAASDEIVGDFLQLAKWGYGVPYISRRNGHLAIELWLPAWNEKKYPEVEGNGHVPFFEVFVIKENVFVPEKVWLYPELLSAEDVFTEPDLEVRRIILNVLGNERVLKDSHAQIVDERDGYRLFRLVNPRDRLSNFCIVECVCPSTGHIYYLRVPAEVQNAREAVAWTFGEREKTYQPVVET